MSIEAKQKFLRESIYNQKLDTESFINFMEEDKDKGADLDNYDMNELEEVSLDDPESKEVQGDLPIKYSQTRRYRRRASIKRSSKDE